MQTLKGSVGLTVARPQWFNGGFNRWINGRVQSPRQRRLRSGFQRLSSSALLSTLTELIAIAAPANTGFR